MLTIADWLAGAAFVAAIAGPAVTIGMTKQKVKDLGDKIENLATRESVNALNGRVGDLETEMKEVPKLVTSVEVMKAEMKGFRDLVTRDTDELKHGNRNIRSSLDAITRQLTEHRQAS